MIIYNFKLSAFDNEIHYEELKVERETDRCYYINNKLRISKTAIDKLHIHLNQMYSLTPDPTEFKRQLIEKFKLKNANLTRLVNMNLMLIEQLERSNDDG